MFSFFMIAHKAACQILSKAFLKSNMVKVLMVLEIFFTWILRLKLRGTRFCSEACEFLNDDVHRLQHDFAWIADEADRSVKYNKNAQK